MAANDQTKTLVMDPLALDTLTVALRVGGVEMLLLGQSRSERAELRSSPGVG
jgi:hypothetical protein